MAERGGFEPPRPFGGLLAFEASAFNHSAISPRCILPYTFSMEDSFPVPLPEKYIALAHELGIDPKKVKERFVRGSGHGGQKINKTSNCVELSYGSPAITVRIQEFREQHKNRQRAWKLLIEKFEGKWKLKESKKERERYKIRKQKGRRSRKAKEKMLKEKKHRGETKRRRKEFLD